jgi:GTPase SAR1 family protein
MTAVQDCMLNTEERRVDPTIDNNAVTFAEMCLRHRQQGQDLTEAQMWEHWQNLHLASSDATPQPVLDEPEMLADAREQSEFKESKDVSTTCSESSLSGVATQPAKFIVIGNPGTGKSTTINCYVGEQLFTSGPSRNGSGVTFELDEMRSNDGRTFLDTPGLSDLKMRKQAAEAIDKALQAGGVFKILFVVCEEEGRWRSDDLTTMKLVIDATRGQISQDMYAVLVNKCDEDFIDELREDPNLKEDTLETLYEACLQRNVPTTRHILFAPMVKAMKRKHNVLMKLDSSVEIFLDSLPILNINKDEVDEVKHQQFEEVQEEINNLKAQLQASQIHNPNSTAGLLAGVAVQQQAHLFEERYGKGLDGAWNKQGQVAAGGLGRNMGSYFADTFGAGEGTRAVLQGFTAAAAVGATAFAEESFETDHSGGVCEDHAEMAFGQEALAQLTRAGVGAAFS